MPGRAYSGISLNQITDKAVRDALRAIDLYLRDQRGPASSTSAATGGIAQESFVVLAAATTLTDERVLTVTAPLTKVDSGPGGTINLALTVAALGGTPALTYGTTVLAGAATTFLRTDDRVLYPSAIMSPTTSFTVAASDDGTDLTLTAGGGVLNIVPGTGIDIDFPNSSAAQLIIRPNTTTAASTVVSVQGRPVAGSRTLMAPNWFSPSASDIFSGQTFRCWDAQFSSFAGQITSCVFVGHDISVMTISPSAGSGAGNKAYGFRAANLTIGNANATWDEIATAYFPGPDRVFSAVTATVTSGVIVEPAVVGGTKQTGILIRQRAAEQTATDRIGLEIEAQNSGTSRYSMKALTDYAWLGGTLFDDNAKGKYGTGRDAELYYDGTDFVCDPDVVGSGSFDIRGPLKCDSITNDTGLAAGVYTPTRSAEANMDANVTMTEAQYMRVGNTVTVSGRFTADPTLTATTTSFEITLPVASNIGAVEDVAGVAFCGAIAAQGAEIIGVVANDTAKVQWVAGDVTSQSWSYTFSYQVI